MARARPYCPVPSIPNRLTEPSPMAQLSRDRWPVAVLGKTASASLPPSSSMAQAAWLSLWLSIPITKVDTSVTKLAKGQAVRSQR